MRISGWGAEVCSSDLAIYLILGAVFLTMVLVTANTMIQAFKERVHELGILKTLGFTGPAVLGLILAGALLILFIGGAIRSEERRVGNERVSKCRSRGPCDNEKKKQNIPTKQKP